jgi:3'-5' exoribonuclease
VKAQGRTNLFNGRLQFVIENIRRVMVGPDSQDRREGFREELLLPCRRGRSTRCGPSCSRWWRQSATRTVRALLERIVTKTEERLRIWPAARAVHHAYRGGFLEHVLKMARAGRVLANEYDANADLVVAGALLHDIGKLEELDYGTTTSYTREGNLVGT